MASDKEEVTCPLLLDYSIAFDTVDHDILLTILKDVFRITGTALDWIRSFLVGRYQIFQDGQDKSSRVRDCPLWPSSRYDQRSADVYSIHS